jgi:hypothetical protein
MVFFESIENGPRARTLVTSKAVSQNLLLSVLRVAKFSHDQDPKPTYRTLTEWLATMPSAACRSLSAPCSRCSRPARRARSCVSAVPATFAPTRCRREPNTRARPRSSYRAQHSLSPKQGGPDGRKSTAAMAAGQRPRGRSVLWSRRVSGGWHEAAELALDQPG